MSSTNSGGVAFRPEIEGLRGALVLLVIVFHAGVAAFEGVYFSVDIFFVLSGYLMGLIILADIRNERFSILGFYERRVRRVFPVLYLVVFISLIAAYPLLPATEYENMGESALWILGLAGNFYFANSSAGYFDADMGLQPFMHVWTLGLEQQYYLFIPLLFALCFSVYRRLRVDVALAFLAATSFCAAIALVYDDAQTAFYVPYSRFWEFALGSLLAVSEARMRAVVPEWLHARIADLGALVVVVVFCVATAHWVHPGPATIAPVFGSLAFIGFANRSSLFYKLLSLKPLLQIGAISYSLYLWHQVFFALGRWYSPVALSGLEYLALTIGATLLSVVTFRLVEVPFRNRRQISPKAFWAVLLLATIPLYFTAKYIDRKHGVEERLPEVVRTHYQEQNFRSVAITADSVACYTVLKSGPCPIGDPEKPRNWALVGDSHAAALTTALDKAFREREIAGYAIFRNACALTLGSRLVGSDSQLCQDHNMRLMERLAKADIEGVVIVGRYPYFLDRDKYENGEGGVESGRQQWFEPVADYGLGEDRETALLQSFVAPVKALLELGKEVVLIYPIPEMGWHVPHYHFKRLMRGDNPQGDISISLARYRERVAPVVEAFDALGEWDNLVRVKPEDVFCSEAEARCYAQLNGRLLYLDDDHLNNFGASLLVSDVMSVVFGDASLSSRIVTRF
ncbi:acyltransferase family protein [Litorivivens sp.]|uniref:acyltransferase family protein n=1 Tax=Litorivivens sp. TaxID=2020868 RepID=UPI0035678C50